MTTVRVHAAVFALASDVVRHDATDASDDAVASDAPYASDNAAICFNGGCSDDAASFSRVPARAYERQCTRR